MIVSPMEREFLLSFAHALNARVEPGLQWDTPPAEGAGLRPGDDFNARGRWQDILEPHGWTAARESGSVIFWTRPDKEDGWSATTGFCKAGDVELLYVFSTSCSPFASEKSYSKFGAYTLLNHSGDYKAAARALAGKGFGEQRQASPVNGTNGHVENGKSEPVRHKFTEPIPASELKKSESRPWLWHGYLAPGSITLLSALWKAGKTTLISHLLKSFEQGGQFCGMAVAKSKVLYVTEESEHRWACRRDQLGLHDHVSFMVRPFRGRADWAQWEDFTLHLAEVCRRNPVDLVVMDPLVNLWPVRDENDNSQVISALLPLQSVTDGSSLMLVHHHRKGDGQEATASRGAGSLTGFVDTIVELRRLHPQDRQDRRRVLTGYGRDDETPEELVIELTDGGYLAHGDKSTVASGELLPTIAIVLPHGPPGLTQDEILSNWPDGILKPSPNTIRIALGVGLGEGTWRRMGSGRRGSPYTFYLP